MPSKHFLAFPLEPKLSLYKILNEKYAACGKANKLNMLPCHVVPFFITLNRLS
jgi:hypothetical protein